MQSAQSEEGDACWKEMQSAQHEESDAFWKEIAECTA